MVLPTELVAGLSGGLVSSLCLHPLDLVKVRFQVLRLEGHSTLQAFRNIIAHEGVSGLYKGVSAAMLGSGLSWGLYFFFYDGAKARHRTWSSSAATTDRLPPLRHVAAALEAGVCTTLLTNPLWLIKTRLQLQVEAKESNYRGIVDAARSIVRQEGAVGLYKGVGPALLLTSHGAVQFGIYEELKLLCKSMDVAPSDQLYFVMGALSKMVASTVTYPYQVIKSRVQQRFDGPSPYSGAWDCAKKTLRSEGWQAFFLGLRPNLYRVVPQSALTLVVYERVKRMVTALEE